MKTTHRFLAINQVLSLATKSNSFNRFRHARARAVTSFILLACGPVFGATFTWDPANTGNGATINAGSGTWNTTTGNIVWNDAGTNKIWAQTSATSPLHSSVFAGADGTYAITVGESLATQSLTFSNSGYTLSAASAVEIRVTPASGINIISVASGKSATIGTNVNVRSTGASGIVGGGTLNITGTGATVRSTGASNFTLGTSGTTVNVGTGGTLSAGASLIVGNNAAANIAVNVNGGNVTVDTNNGGTAVLVLANSTSTGSATFTLTNGTVTNTATSGGLRFGQSSGVVTTSGTFHLDGGILTVARVFEGVSSTTSTFNFNGGTLKTLAGTTTAATFMAGIDTVNVRNGGAIFDTNNVSTTVAQALAHSSIGGDLATDGGLTKNGLGTLTLSGANTYTGATAINGGALVFANKAAKTAATATAAAAGSIGLGVKASDAAYYSATDVGNLFNSNTLSGFNLNSASGVAIDTTNAGGSFDQTVALNAASRSLTKTGTGTLILSQNNTYSDTTIEAGTLQIGTGGTSGTLGSGAVINNGALAFNRSDDVSISNVISGTGSLTKNGTNTLTSSVVNTFTGPITINGGTLEFSATNAGNNVYGSTQININGASTLRVSGTAANIPIFAGKNYTFDSIGGGKIELGSGGNYDAGVALQPFAITTNGGAQNTIKIIADAASGANGFNLGGSVATFNVALGSDATSDLVVTPIISNSGSVLKTGAGRLAFGAANTYTGATTISNGSLHLGTGGTTGALTGTSGIANDANLTVNRSNNFSQATDLNNKAIGGSGSFTQAGSGTTTLSLTNTYAGPTNVNAGTLIINGSTSSTSLVTVASGATLGGSGTVGGNTTISGTHSPGTSPGIQSFGGNLSSTTGSSVTWELVSDAIGVRGTDFDGINVASTLDFTGTTSINLVFNFAGSTVDWTDAFWNTSRTGTSGWLVYAVAGTTANFGNLSVTAANWLDGSGGLFNTTRSGNTFSLFQDGNDIYLNYNAVPEPRAALLGGFGLLCLLRRRR